MPECSSVSSSARVGFLQSSDLEGECIVVVEQDTIFLLRISCFSTFARGPRYVKPVIFLPFIWPGNSAPMNIQAEDY